MELPLFPLHAVLCPGVALPLQIFEPRYRAMIARCLEERLDFGIVLIRTGREVGAGPLTLATVGTIAEIREAHRLGSGRYRLLVVGARRFRIGSVTVGRQPYLVGDVEQLDEPVGDIGRARQLTARATRAFVRYLSLLQPTEGEDADEIDVRVEVDLVDPTGSAQPMLGAAIGGPDQPDGRTGEDAGADPPDVLAANLGRADDEGDEGDEGDDADEAAVHLDAVARDVAIPDDPTVLSYLLSGIIQVEPPRRQGLLEAGTTELRLEELLRLIDREIVLLERRLRNYSADPALATIRRN